MLVSLGLCSWVMTDTAQGLFLDLCSLVKICNAPSAICLARVVSLVINVWSKCLIFVNISLDIFILKPLWVFFILKLLRICKKVSSWCKVHSDSPPNQLISPMWGSKVAEFLFIVVLGVWRYLRGGRDSPPKVYRGEAQRLSGVRNKWGTAR